MAHHFSIYSLSLLILLGLSTAYAEVISITDPSIEVPNSPEGIIRPKRSETMAEVKKRYGDPLSVFPTVGDPPITRWQYEKFTVVFENDKVIHSVINKP